MGNGFTILLHERYFDKFHSWFLTYGISHVHTTIIFEIMDLMDKWLYNIYKLMFLKMLNEYKMLVVEAGMSGKEMRV